MSVVRYFMALLRDLLNKLRLLKGFQNQWLFTMLFLMVYFSCVCVEKIGEPGGEARYFVHCNESCMHPYGIHLSSSNP